MASTIKIYKNDTSPDITFSLARKDGTIPNLTGCTVKFKIQDPLTGQRTNDSHNTCTIVNPGTNGVVTYAWNNTDLPDPGTYSANLVVYYTTLDPEGNPQKETVGYTIQVSDTV